MGPTATGKSALGIALAERFDGEIISCDSTAVYRGFDIGTDKVPLSEQHGIKMAVDRKSELYLDGTVLDFYDGLEKRGFTFNNPNAVKSCGCGSSFSA